MVSEQTIRLLLPEIVLIAAGTWIYVAGAFTKTRSGLKGFAVASLILAGFILFRQGAQLSRAGLFAASGHEVAYGPIIADYFAHTVRWMALGIGLLFSLIAWRTERNSPADEYTGSLLMVVAGLMLVSSANELILLFLGLELISIPTYVLLFLARPDAAAQEAGTKYFFLSILSSALLLYGFSFLYGVAGSTQLADLYARLSGNPANHLMVFARLALVMIFAGLGFRLTAVPFHFYAPDVYQGTNNPNAGLLATLPKIAAIVVLVRIIAAAMPGMERLGWQIALALSVVTMTLGNFMALWQNHVRRLMAYSSIAHGGYLLIGIAVGLAAGTARSGEVWDGIAASIFYLAVYVLATAGTFAALAYLDHHGKEINTVDELAGLGRTHVGPAVAIAIFMFSLTGIPPLAGFWGKVFLFGGALNTSATEGLRTWFIGLAVIGVINAAVSAGYYLRIVGTMFFRPATSQAPAEGGPGAYAAMLICAVLVVGIGIASGPLVDVAANAGKSARVLPKASTMVTSTMNRGDHLRPTGAE
jgi:NADH-quinone oxidoreductase subunit N